MAEEAEWSHRIRCDDHTDDFCGHFRASEGSRADSKNKLCVPGREHTLAQRLEGERMQVVFGVVVIYYYCVSPS